MSKPIEVYYCVQDTEFLIAGSPTGRSELRKLIDARCSVYIDRGDRLRVKLQGFRIYISEGFTLRPNGNEWLDLIA